MKLRTLVLVPAVLAALAAPAMAQEAPKAAAASSETDHSMFVGHFALTYFGVTQIPLGFSVTPSGSNVGSMAAPAIGGRYWLNEKMAIDAGLGIGLVSSSATGTNGGTSTTVDLASPFGFVLHGGVPLAMAAGKHYTFEIIPELNIGYASQTDKPTGGGEVKHSGYRIEAGARAGAEVHFGFIGVPELALQASVGLLLSAQGAKTSTTNGGNTSENSISTIGFGTTVQSAPWAIFTNNISALYYF